MRFGKLKNFCCHKCNNRRCVNPDHLYDGTPKENVHDSIVAGTAASVKFKKFTNDDLIAYLKEDRTRTLKDASYFFGCSHQAIYTRTKRNRELFSFYYEGKE